MITSEAIIFYHRLYYPAKLLIVVRASVAALCIDYFRRRVLSSYFESEFFNKGAFPVPRAYKKNYAIALEILRNGNTLNWVPREQEDA
jgi:hypothetical protein